MKKQVNKSQVFTEYVILIAIVAAVLIGMRIYIVRAMQQKFRESADVFGEGEQYAKGVTEVSYNDTPGTPPIPIIPPKDICPGLLSKIEVLEGEIKELNERAESFEQSALDLNTAATDLDKQIAILREQAEQLRTRAADYESKANQKDSQALAKRNEAKSFNDQADIKKNELDALKRANPSCYSGCGCVSGSEPACQTMNEIAVLEKERDSLYSQAAEKEAQANAKQADIDFYKTNFPGCFSGAQSCPYMMEIVAKLEGEIGLLRSDGAELNTQAANKGNEANIKKATIPGCYSGSGCMISCEEDGEGSCCCVLEEAAQLEFDIADLRSKAALANAAAALLEDEAQELHDKAASLYASADKADQSADDLEETQIPSLEDQAKDFQEKAAEARSAAEKKQEQIDQFKIDYPKCFP
ncbi:MAG: hypothetical protein PHT50_02470 [Candidatus Omnitrophica bacterium]|nr:hypothetical protein [Candidatus Omnitrophota bacterium]